MTHLKHYKLITKKKKKQLWIIQQQQAKVNLVFPQLSVIV